MGNRSGWTASPPVLAREDCALCQGTGWELLTGAASSLARRCACRVEAASVRLNERVRIPRRYHHCTLESFRPLNFSHVRAHAEACRFSERFPHMDRGLLFAGQAGVGKTHLAVGIVRELLLRFHDDILFVDFPTLLASTRETEWERSRKVSLLLVDNFGLAKPSSHNVCATEQLLRSRTDTGNCTILTGDRVSLRYLFGAGGDALQSPTQELLRSLSPGLLLSFLGRTRIVSMVGDDYRAAHALSKSLLFP